MVVDGRKDGGIEDRWLKAMMDERMSRDDQKHVSGSGLHVYQDPREELKWIGVGGYGTRPQGNGAVGWGDLRMTLVYQVFIMVLVQGA